MTEQEIEEVYEIVKRYYEQYLRDCGVKLPRLKNKDGTYVKDALVLVYLAKGYPETVLVSKGELTKFIRKFYPYTNDVQQARHLAMQKGWYIAAGGRDNVHVSKRGEYCLVTLEKPYPNFKGHRIEATEEWEKVKKQYSYRCATCGSKEGEKNFHYPNTKTNLQKAHRDPSKQLIKGNIIPQCQKCNRAYRDFWVFDERGRVSGIANPNVVKKCSKDVKKAIYKLLYNEFNGEDPNE